MTSVDFLELGAYWTLDSRSDAIEIMIGSVNEVFLAGVEKVPLSSRFGAGIPSAIGMPGTGKSRLVMVELVMVVEALARQYHACGKLASTTVTPVLVTFNSNIGIHRDDPKSESLEAVLAWHALHAYFGYKQDRQRYETFLSTFAPALTNADSLTLLEAMRLIAAAADSEVLVLVVDEVQVLNYSERWPHGGARDCVQLLRELQRQALAVTDKSERPLIVCCAVAGTRSPGGSPLIASLSSDPSETLQV